MALQPIPEGYHTVTPYLVVPGVEKLLEFLKGAFDAHETERMTRDDGSIGHAEVRIGDSRVMMGEPTGRWTPMPASVYLYTDDCDGAYTRAIEAGAESLQEPENQFYGDRMAGVRDQSGNIWWISTHVEELSPQEMAKRTQEWAAR